MWETKKGQQEDHTHLTHPDQGLPAPLAPPWGAVCLTVLLEFKVQSLRSRAPTRRPLSVRSGTCRARLGKVRHLPRAPLAKVRTTVDPPSTPPN